MEREDHVMSKFTVPQVFHKLLPRKGIAEIIDGASLYEAICLVAPYGCGKTLSVISWLRERGLKAAWLSLDQTISSEDALYAGVSAAIAALSGYKDGIDSILSDERFISGREGFLSEKIEEAERNGHDRVLVIDNCRYVIETDMPYLLKSITFSLLGHWRVILINRMELPTVFTELIMKGHIRLITPRELNFSPEEMSDFFSINGCDAAMDDILRIRTETEGWPASLNVILTISRGGQICYGDAARAYVMGFFETEIWNELGEVARDFLLRTSILDKLTPAACRALTSLDVSLPMLRWLFANGLFISRLDERDTYCYHRVFLDFLRDKLAASDIDERELYRKLAWWLFDKNEIVQALPYFFKVGDMYGVGQALKVIDLADMTIEELFEATECIMPLDVSALKPFPIIVARIALIEFLKGNVSRMQTLMGIYDEYNDIKVLSRSPEEYAEYLWESRWLCYLNPDETSLDNKRHYSFGNYRYYVPHLKDAHLARGALLNFPSFFRSIRDYGDDGIFMLEGVLERVENGEKYLIDEEESVWKTYMILAEYKYETENFAKAEEIIRRVIALVEESGYTDIYFNCVYVLVKLMRAVHNTAEIGAVLSHLESVIKNSRHTFLLPNFHAFELRNRLADGYVGFTEAFERENRDYADKPYFYLHYRHLTLARGHISLGNYSRAMLILGNLELLFSKFNRNTDLIEVNILKSVALYGLGYEDDACRHLQNAISSAEKFGYIRIFSDDARMIWPVLELVRRQSSGKYIRNIVISCKKTLTRAGIKIRGKHQYSTDLTKSELNILKALQTGMSYEEIALDNNIKLSTVKSHVHSVYSKLDVDNRTSAIMAAQGTGILE